MRRGFYQRFALDSIKKNRQLYLPYMITCILMTTLFFIIQSLAQNSGLDEMSGKDALTFMFGIGSRLMAIFSIIFLFYTNNFLMKQRKHEFGLYNVLGMEKRHISRIVFFETLLIGGGSIVIGILAGLLFSKLAFAGIVRLMDMEVPLGFEICVPAIYQTILLFVIIHFLLFLNSFRQIHSSNTIELLYGSNVGEKEPKVKWPLAVIGIVSLALGYGISITITNPLGAFTLFFLAVILVVIGTYFLFTAGSIAWLKLMKKNKRFYYQPRHFINVSGMLYRMKQNAASLASICILSTMVIVTVSTTLSLYIGCGDITRQRYPRAISLNAQTDLSDNTDAFFDQSVDLLDDIIREENLDIYHAIQVRYLAISAQRNGDHFENDPSKADDLRLNDMCSLTFLPLEDYNRITHSAYTLKDDEILVSSSYGETWDHDTLPVGDMQFHVKENVEEQERLSELFSGAYNNWFIIVRDMDAVRDIFSQQKEYYEDAYTRIQYYYGVDINAPEQEQRIADSFDDRFAQTLAESGLADDENQYFSAGIVSRAEKEKDFLSLYAGFFFVGIFLTAVFLTATILIIYYKQISEGLQDARRFEIMQKVGLSRDEIKKCIHSQILMVFFLPLAVAGMHAAFAFPIISRFLRLLAMTNVKAYIICLIGSFIVFAVVYILVYFLTARRYYTIVSK